MSEKNFSITKNTNEPSVSLFIKKNRRPICRMKNKILGEDYSLGVVFISDTESKKLNRTYRKKDKPTDILSFPLSETEGEIFLTQNQIIKESVKFSRPIENFTLFLLIHGLCHLKGLTHGSKMESEERKYRDLFGV